MGPLVTKPLGFDTHAWRPRLVVEELPGAIRLHRAKSALEALAVRDDWRSHNYTRYPGEVRIFNEVSHDRRGPLV